MAEIRKRLKQVAHGDHTMVQGCDTPVDLDTLFAALTEHLPRA
jgi:hypothetical protein